ncbi:cupin domain-containing protein [Paenibacillus xylanexedens]|uniref:Cupin superfamily sugar epimerase n=1 Tax=Paenibacillus xylanexedens TaxID=528191 RepID=A0ABS4RZ50_PAEXY|nr:cupin domain-containing protein [Paenibacillus xylanexedens]MBP2248167.1 putative cupin superfamily sugar epimerase [Paenibacillus xylanexedens]
MTTHELSPLVAALNMQPHVEGGWYKEEWKASYQIPQSVLPDTYSGPRFSASSTYFLLHAHEISDWHTVLSDELWLWHSGSPVELKLGGNGENPENEEVLVLGMDIAAGQSPQVLVPAGVWQTARPLGDEPVLVTCVVAPGFHFDDFKLVSKGE